MPLAHQTNPIKIGINRKELREMKLHFLGVIGGGNRGKHLARLASKTGRAKIVAVAEPDETQIKLFQTEFSLSSDNCYQDYKDLLNSNLRFDGILVTTPPFCHAEITCACLEKGIPVFLEKPMASNLKDARKIVDAVEKTGTFLQIGFNCLYAPFFVQLKDIVSSGKLGRILSLEWKEIITPFHWSTYCRYPSYSKRSVIGSWLLEKCCHDLDLINWLIESPCIRVASFGNRSYFKRRSDTPEYCTDGCPIEKECIFSAFRFYPELKENLSTSLPKYKTRCVYNSDSDLVDHQSVILEYENGVTVCFSLIPLGQKNTRQVYICGTEATLRGDWDSNEIRLYPHQTNEEVICDPELSYEEEHGGADPKIVSAFLDSLDNPLNQPKTTEKEGWEAMVVGCGIDLALRERRVVDLELLQ